ncbi:MAG: VOC family protein, partial [bacterium]|nr:VOC family protein [bacterium]
MEPRVSFITLGVLELTRATRFYCDVLAFGLLPSSTADVSFFSLGALRLALYPRHLLAAGAGVDNVPDNVPDNGAGVTAGPTFALSHNVASAAAVDALLAHVQQHAGPYGCRVTRVGAATAWGGYMGYFADPDGFLWEVAW